MALSCAQISSLMTFYINGKLDFPLKQMFEEHLKNCPSCYNKYKALESILNKFFDAKKKIDEMSYEPEEIEEEDILDDESKYVLVQNLSAYSDNELSVDDSLKVKKYIVTNLSARKTLEEIYTLRKILKNSFGKTASQMKRDFTKAVLKQLDLENELKYGGSRLKVASIFIFLLTSLTIGVVYIVSSLLV